jgi:uncharacterized membrane protein
MSELVVMSFDLPEEADRVLTKLSELERESLIDLDDAVVAVRNSKGRVRLKQSINVGTETRKGLLSGALFGTFVGLLLLNPLAGLALGGAIGAGAGALAGHILDFEISDDFIRQLAQRLRPNSSALFLLVRRVKPDQVLAELERFHGHVLRSTLPASEEARLAAALARRQQSDAATAAPVSA